MQTFPKKQIILKVSQINQYIRQTLEENFSSVWIKGEISNFVAPSSGHWYFSLKEEGVQIKAVMFRGHNQKLSFLPKNGSEVLVHGQISVYTPRGTYQVLCDEIELLGSGILQKNFEELKRKLEKEGLFEKSQKKQIPSYPRHIGIITSETGAALQDILQVLKRRSRGLKITLIPALVQGQEAPKSLLAALKQAGQLSDLDTLIIGRGGGTMEDLSVFNDETLARALAQFKTPIISAVGHEIDFTICDFVSDLRVPTPSAAAELVVKNTEDLLEQINNRKKQLVQNISLQIKFFKEKIKGLQKQLISPERLLQDRFQRVDEICSQLCKSIRQNLLKEKTKLKNLEQLLKSLNPKQVMQRGFCIALGKNDKVITNSKQLKIKEEISLEFFKGGAKTLVTSKE